MNKINIEELNKSLNGNVLGRKNDLVMINDILKNSKGIKLGISADWGAGKTFVAQFIYHMSKYDLDVDVINECKELDYIQKAKVIYFDASKEDIFDNSLLSIARTIALELEKEKGFKKSTFLKGLYEILSNIEGVGSLFKIARGVKIASSEENVFDEFKNTDEIIEQIKSVFSKDDNYILLIDELDRCDPEYILKLFNVIKNFYTLDNLQIVYFYNYRELWNLVKTKYGYENEQYIQKYIDYEISLSKEFENDYAMMLYGSQYSSSYLAMCQAMYDLNPREVKNLKFIYEKENFKMPLFACIISHCLVKRLSIDLCTEEDILNRLVNYEEYDYARGLQENFKESLKWLNEYKGIIKAKYNLR